MLELAWYSGQVRLPARHACSAASSQVGVVDAFGAGFAAAAFFGGTLAASGFFTGSEGTTAEVVGVDAAAAGATGSGGAWMTSRTGALRIDASTLSRHSISVRVLERL